LFTYHKERKRILENVIVNAKLTIVHMHGSYVLEDCVESMEKNIVVNQYWQSHLGKTTLAKPPWQSHLGKATLAKPPWQSHLGKATLGKNKRNVGYFWPAYAQIRAVVILILTGELGGPGDLVIQDRLVADTQRSSGLYLADFPGTKVSAL